MAWGDSKARSPSLLVQAAVSAARALGLLGREGATVICADIDAAAAEATAAQIHGANGRAAALGLDIRDRSAVDCAVAAAVREFGRLDVLLDCYAPPPGRSSTSSCRR